MENVYKNKGISILGDSISTFRGYIPEKNATRYPQDDLLTDVSLTWWMRVISALGARLLVNESFAGTQVSNGFDTNQSHLGNIGPSFAMTNMHRIENLSANGTPDYIFLYGGTNDIARRMYPIGVFDKASANTAQSLDTIKWDNFIAGYAACVLRIRRRYPDSTLISILPGYVAGVYTADVLDSVNTELIKLCEHFGIKYIDLRHDGITEGNAREYLPDRLHPNADGMALIADHILKELLS